MNPLFAGDIISSQTTFKYFLIIFNEPFISALTNKLSDVLYKPLLILFPKDLNNSSSCP